MKRARDNNDVDLLADMQKEQLEELQRAIAESDGGE